MILMWSRPGNMPKNITTETYTKHNNAAYATSGAEAAIGTAYPSREPKFIPFLVWFVLVFYVVFCR
jgi:t-SNARE complex subunit (syntaxin)